MGGILANWTSNEGKVVDLHIYDGPEAMADKLLFDTHPASVPHADSLFYQQRTIEFHGSQWLLEFDAKADTATISYAGAWATLIGGFALSGLLCGLMLSLINTRIRARVIANSLTEEIRRRESLLKDSEFRWKFAIEGSGDGVWDWNIETNHATYSKIWKEMLGYADDDTRIHEDWVNDIHPDDQQYVATTLQDYLEGRTAIYVVEYRLRCKDGSYKWILARGMAVSRGADGKALRMLGTHTDITKRKQAEAALQESEDRFRKLLMNIPSVAVQGYGEDGTTRYWNQASEQLYGYSADEAIGRNLLELIIPIEMRDGVRDAMREMFETTTPIPAGELSLRRKDGSRVDVFSSHAYVRVPGRAAEMFCVDIDISERKQTEAELLQHRHHLEELVLSRTAELSQARDDAEAANRAKSMFLANMSHELRTPMNGIMGMNDLVLRRATDPKQIDWLNKSQGAAKHLLSVINDILDISKIESDRLTLEEQDFSLAEAIDDAMHMQDAPAQAKGLSLSWHIDPALPDQLCGDAMRLRQILINFTGNAIKFSEHGQITVRASAAEEDSHCVLLKIEVTDQGAGISPEQQARLFHAFVQADGTMNRKYGGTGLGLIISRRIALLMGGDAGVISEEGHGSTFWATVRLRRAASGSPAEKSRPAEPPREALARLFPGVRVLVAEDEPVNREVLLFLLEDAGLAPDIASNGREAVEKARGGGYALILMDVQMPVMSGLEATRAIRQIPGMANIPILALTANAFDEDRDACLAAGMDDHIGKPVEPDALCAIVLRWLQTSSGSTLA
jgi:PAS domain S-box-containing protein